MRGGAASKTRGACVSGWKKARRQLHSAVVQDRHTLTGSVGLRSKEEIKAMLDGCK